MKLHFLPLLLLPLVTHSQIINSSFEDWYTDSLGQRRLVGWQHLQKSNAPADLIGTSRENNSQHLNYAIRLSRWYDYTWDKIFQSTSVKNNPATLTGYYKYTDNDLIGDRTKDTAYVRIYITKWNVIRAKTDTLGQGYIELGPSVGYRLFECPIQYLMPGTADSLVLDISPSKWEGVGTFCATPGYCSFFTLDNLVLNGTGATPIFNVVFPNPSQNVVSIRLDADGKGFANIVNGLGQVVLRKPVVPGNNSFYIHRLPAGIYFLQIFSANSKVGTYKFVKQ